MWLPYSPNNVSTYNHAEKIAFDVIVKDCVLKFKYWLKFDAQGDVYSDYRIPQVVGNNNKHIFVSQIRCVRSLDNINSFYVVSITIFSRLTIIMCEVEFAKSHYG